MLFQRWGKSLISIKMMTRPPIKKKFLATDSLLEEPQTECSEPLSHGSSGKGQTGFNSDIIEWQNFLAEQNIDAEIAVIVNQRGADADGGEILPVGMNEATDMPEFSKVYRAAGRDNANAAVPNMPDGGVAGDPDDQAAYLMSLFNQHTNNGTGLAGCIGSAFVDTFGFIEIPGPQSRTLGIHGKHENNVSIGCYTF